MKKGKTLNRRDFIKLSSIAFASLPIVLSGFPIFSQQKPKGYSFSNENENVLVLIQLQGGNDGLNTIFDLNQYQILKNIYFAIMKIHNLVKTLILAIAISSLITFATILISPYLF